MKTITKNGLIYFAECLQYVDYREFLNPEFSDICPIQVIDHFKKLNLRFNNSAGSLSTKNGCLSKFSSWGEEDKYKTYHEIMRYEFMGWINNGLSRLHRQYKLLNR